MAAEQASGAARHGDRLWLLINLEIWQRIFLDGESPELRDGRGLAARIEGGVMRILWVKDGRPVAANQRRPDAEPPDHLGVVAPA